MARFPILSARAYNEAANGRRPYRRVAAGDPVVAAQAALSLVTE